MSRQALPSMCPWHKVPLIWGVCPDCEGQQGQRDGLEAVALLLLFLVLITVVVVVAWLG